MKFESKLTPSSVSLEDQEALKELVLFAPRREYAEGKRELNFEHRFSTGESLAASEDEGGIAHLVIRKRRYACG